MWKEFKAFILRGSIFDMAVGIIIGGAFGKIITSLVDDIIMPLVGLIMGGVDFSTLKYAINAESSINYGNFIQQIVDFLIIALCIFFMIKGVAKASAKFKKEEEAKVEDVVGPTQEELLGEIRDLLKEKNN